MKKLIPVLFGALLLASCATSSFVSTAPQAKKEVASPIPCYYASDKPGKPYEVMGHVETSGFVFASNKHLVFSMQKTAREKGADAIINIRFSYIPALLIGIPYAEGDLVKFKQ